MKGNDLESADLARKLVDLLSEKQAEEIVLLNIEGLAFFTDYFVIASGQNARHMQALYDALDEDLSNEHVRIWGHEGAAESGWILIDLGDVIVHIFSPEERAYYDLESLWSRAVTVLRVQ